MLKFSIVTVCFNAEKTIQETMFSVLNQSYKNIEYIIIDGKSKDNTLDVISRMQSQYEHCDLKVVSEPDKGIYDAMNKALKIASGDFLIFLGADDHFISSNVLERFSIFMKDTKCIYYGNVLRPLRNDLYCGKFSKYKLAVKNIPHQSIFYCKEVYKKYAYDINMKIFADYKYNILAWKDYRYVYVNLTVSYFESAGASGTVRDVAFEKEYQSLVIQSLGFWPYVYSSIYRFLRNIIK